MGIMEPYCIVYTPPAFHLMELLGRISHPTELLSYLCGKDASRIDAGNYKDFLDGLPPLQRKGMSETLAIDCYTLTYVANLIARCGFRGKIILADGKRRTLGEAITARGGNPAAVFITAISYNFPAAVATALALNHGRIPVLLGGIHVSTIPHDVPTYIRRHAPFPELIAQVIGPADSGNMTQILGDLSTNYSLFTRPLPAQPPTARYPCAAAWKMVFLPWPHNLPSANIETMPT